MINFKKISPYKIINVIVFFCLLALVFGLDYYFKKGYCLDSCSYEFLAGWVAPFVEAQTLLLVVFGAFIFLPSYYFKKWLFYIASWAFPVLLYFISAESVYTSSIQSGPDFIAGIGMVILTALSALFVIGVFVHLQLQKYWQKRSK